MHSNEKKHFVERAATMQMLDNNLNCTLGKVNKLATNYTFYIR